MYQLLNPSLIKALSQYPDARLSKHDQYTYPKSFFYASLPIIYCTITRMSCYFSTPLRIFLHLFFGLVIPFFRPISEKNKMASSLFKLLAPSTGFTAQTCGLSVYLLYNTSARS